MNCGRKKTVFKQQTSDIVEHLTQKSSKEEEKISLSDGERFKKWIAMLPVIIRG